MEKSCENSHERAMGGKEFEDEDVGVLRE